MEFSAIQWTHRHNGKVLWDFGPILGVWELALDAGPAWIKSEIGHQKMKLNYSRSKSPAAVYNCQEPPFFKPVHFVRWEEDNDGIKWRELSDPSLIKAIREQSQRGGAEYFREQYCSHFGRSDIPVTGNNPDTAIRDDIGDMIANARKILIEAKINDDMAIMRSLIEHMFKDMRERLNDSSKHNKNMCMADIVDAVKYECIKSVEALVINGGVR